MSKIASVRGMNDLAPEEVRLWTVAEETIKNVFNSYYGCGMVLSFECGVEE